MKRKEIINVAAVIAYSLGFDRIPGVEKSLIELKLPNGFLGILRLTFFSTGPGTIFILQTYMNHEDYVKLTSLIYNMKGRAVFGIVPEILIDEMGHPIDFDDSEGDWQEKFKTILVQKIVPYFQSMADWEKCLPLILQRGYPDEVPSVLALLYGLQAAEEWIQDNVSQTRLSDSNYIEYLEGLRRASAELQLDCPADDLGVTPFPNPLVT